MRDAPWSLLASSAEDSHPTGVVCCVYGSRDARLSMHEPNHVIQRLQCWSNIRLGRHRSEASISRRRLRLAGVEADALERGCRWTSLK